MFPVKHLSSKFLKLAVTIVLLFQASACFEKYSDAGIHTNAEWMIPFAAGSYTISELFDLSDDEQVEAAGRGSFYQFHDTLYLKQSFPLMQSDSLGLVVESVNYLPFEIVLIIQAYDTIQQQVSGDTLQLRLAREATAGDDLWQTVPAVLHSYLLLDGERETWFREATGLKLTVDFIWPHDEGFTVNIDELPEMELLDIQFFLNLKF